MKSAKEFWKEKFGEEPQSDSDKLAVAMMAEYYINRENATPHQSGAVSLRDGDSARIAGHIVSWMDKQVYGNDGCLRAAVRRLGKTYLIQKIQDAIEEIRAT